MIIDFQVGIDDIDLRAMDLTFIGSAAFSGFPGELRYVAGSVLGDLDGNGTADFSIAVSGSPGPAADGFIL